MTMPAVSIVIPCHDAAATVAATVTSCAIQTEVPRELILVDDRCSDDTIPRAQAVARRHGLQVETLSTVEPGLGPARNRGYRAARGQFVLWLDADDVLLPGALASLVRLCAAYRGIPASVTADFLVHDPAAGIEQVVPQRPHPEALTACLRGKFWVPPGAWLWNRAACERLMDAGGFSSAPRMQDREAFAAALLLGVRHRHSNQVVLRYRMAAGQLSQTWPRHRYAEVLRDIWARLRTLATQRGTALDAEARALLEADFRVWRWVGPRIGPGVIPAEVRSRDGSERPLSIRARMLAAAALMLGEPFYADMLATLATRMFPHAEDDHLALRDALPELAHAKLVEPVVSPRRPDPRVPGNR